MRAVAKLSTPADTPLEITLRGTLGEFEALEKAVLNTNIPYWQVQQVLDAIRDASRGLRASVTSEERADGE